MGESGGRGGQPGPRHQAAAAFCAALWCYPDGSPREDLDGLYATIFTTGANRCEWWPLSAPDKIVARLVELDSRDGQTGNIYIGATVTGARESLPRTGGRLRDRPHADDARALVALWADIDIAALGGHGERAYPQTEDDARKLIDRLPLRPTMIVHSGHGWQAWWLLAEPWCFGEIVDQEADRAAAAALSRDWCHTLAAHAEDAGGWVLDSTYDLARLMRPAGTTNRKGAPAVPVRVISADGPTYGLDDLYGALADDAILKTYRLPTVGPEALGGIDLHRVWARVSSLASREREYTPPWLATMFENVPDGTLADLWDTGYDGEDPSQVDARLCRALFDAKCSVEQVSEAMMAIRLRNGHKIEKVDPRQRADYLIRTVGRFRETSRAAAAAREQSRARTDGSAAHAATLHRKIDRPAEETAEQVAEQVAEQQVAPAPPEPASPDPVAARPSSDAVPSNGTDEDVTAPQRDAPTPTAREPESEHDGGAETTHQSNEPGPVADATGDSVADATGDPVADATGDALAGQVIDTVRHPVDEVGGAATGSPRATPPPEGAPSATDPWGKRDEHEAPLLDDLSNLAIHHSYVAEGVRIWRVEYRNHGSKAEGRLVLSLPRSFTWPGNDRPPLYHPGRPLATAWLPRDQFSTHKGFHTALSWDAKITPREMAPKGQQPQPHQADNGTWRAMITALIPYWRRDTSGTDLATAAHEWLRQLLTERPAVRDADDAATSGRPWLADHGAFRAEPPPRIFVARSVLLDFMCAQPGGPAPGPGAASVLELLRLTPRRVRNVGAAAKRMRWLEIEADQFDAQDWAGIVEDTAEAMLQRERNEEKRRGLRLVADGETPRTATEVMQARLVGDDASSEATAVGDTGTPGGSSGRLDYDGEEI